MMDDEAAATSWQRHPGPREFGETYLCADAKGVPFRRILTAGDARDTPYWSQVAWAMPLSALPKPPVRTEDMDR